MSKTVITPEATLSYPSLFEPKPTPSGESKFSASLIFDKQVDLSELRRAAKDAAVAGWGDKAQQMIKSGALRMPFRLGTERPGSKGYDTPGAVFINASTKNPPGVVGRYAGPDGRPQPITDPDELYPGCRVRASLSAFAYDQSGNRGVSFALNNVQKLGEGARLDGRLDASEEFVALEDAPADLERLDVGDEELPPTKRIRGQAARAQQRRRLRRRLDADDDDNAPWDDAAA